MIIYTDYLIIGLSAAGLHAAQTLRRLDPLCSIAAIDYQETLFNKCFFTSYNSGYKKLNEFQLRSSEWFREQQIDWHQSRIVSIDHTTHSAIDNNNNHFKYKKVLIAVGTTVQTFPVVDERILNYHTIQDVQKLYHSLSTQKYKTALVIGGGLNGIEVAHLLAKKNLHVTLLEQKEVLVSTQISCSAQEWLYKYLKQTINIFLKTKVEKIQVIDDQVIAQAPTQLFTADILINCAGTRPNTNWLPTTIERSTRGHIIVNDFQQTSHPTVFAAGDCCINKSSERFSSLWTDAALQGIHAAYSMLEIPHQIPSVTNGGDTKFPDFPLYWRGDMSDCEVEHVPIIEKNDSYYRELWLDKGQKLRGFILIGTLNGAGELTQQFLRD